MMQDNFKNEKLDLKNRRLLIVYVVMAVIIIFYVTRLFEIQILDAGIR